MHKFELIFNIYSDTKITVILLKSGLGVCI